jgi:hypothetical protein
MPERLSGRGFGRCVGEVCGLVKAARELFRLRVVSVLWGLELSAAGGSGFGAGWVRWRPRVQSAIVVLPSSWSRFLRCTVVSRSSWHRCRIGDGYYSRSTPGSMESCIASRPTQTHTRSCKTCPRFDCPARRARR